MPNEFSAKSSVSQKPRSYTYGANAEYQTDDGANWLPFKFWRETIGFCRNASEAVTSEKKAYSDEYVNQQMVVWTSAVATYTNRLFVVAVIAALVGILQWSEIHSGSTDTHNLAEAAKTQAENSQKALIASERAWIGPIDAAITQLGKDQTVKATYQYRNTGREPAPALISAQLRQYYENEFGQTMLGSTEDILTDLANCKANGETTGAFVFPSSGFSQFAGSIESDGPAIVNKFKADDAILAGKKVITLTGCFSYRTQRQVRHTAFCFFYKAKTTLDMAHLNICPIGWHAD